MAPHDAAEHTGSPDAGNDRARAAWSANARFWDERMAEGNSFFHVLIWPAVERLLEPKPGDRILDVACGNGVTSRRLAEAGASVTAVDFAEEMISIAEKRAHGAEIDYRVIDATDAPALMALGAEAFDSALCSMALMDMAEITPLARALAVLLRPGGAFVFAITHPCFNNPSTVQMAELEDKDGAIETTYSVKISRYLTSYTRAGLAMHGQPLPHPYFHRSLESLLRPWLRAGLVLDDLEERTFPPESPQGTTPLSWGGAFSEIPPVLAVRLRRPPLRA